MKSFVRCALLGCLVGYGLCNVVPVIADSCELGCKETDHWFKRVTAVEDGICYVYDHVQAKLGRVTSDDGDLQGVPMATRYYWDCPDTTCGRFCDVELNVMIHSTGAGVNQGCTGDPQDPEGGPYEEARYICY